MPADLSSLAQAPNQLMSLRTSLFYHTRVFVWRAPLAPAAVRGPVGEYRALVDLLPRPVSLERSDRVWLQPKQLFRPNPFML